MISYSFNTVMLQICFPSMNFEKHIQAILFSENFKVIFAFIRNTEIIDCINIWADEETQCIKTLPVRSDGLSLIPWQHLLREN